MADAIPVVKPEVKPKAEPKVSVVAETPAEPEGVKVESHNAYRVDH